MSVKPYEAQIDNRSGYYVSGPAPGGECDFNGWYLYPETRFDSEAAANSAAIIANIAYREGYKQAQADIRKALGVPK